MGPEARNRGPGVPGVKGKPRWLLGSWLLQPTPLVPSSSVLPPSGTLARLPPHARDQEEVKCEGQREPWRGRHHISTGIKIGKSFI